MDAEKLANKFVGYMLAEIQLDIKNGKIVSNSDLEERFREDYKAWKQVMMSDKFTTLYAAEVEKLKPSMRNHWK